MKRLLNRLIQADLEAPKVLGFIRRERRADGRPLDVLDVGCGYGRYLRLLRKSGNRPVGIEKNPGIVAANCAEGLECLTPEDFTAKAAQFDVLLMSHIVEHLTPTELLDFLDTYLDFLRPDGILIVATPLMSPYFYDDFDHVKPYHPTGFLMILESDEAQVQYRSRNRLQLTDLWFRRSHLKPVFFRSKYLRASSHRFGRRALFLLEAFNALLFHLTFGLLGRTDGWIGVFRKS